MLIVYLEIWREYPYTRYTGPAVHKSCTAQTKHGNSGGLPDARGWDKGIHQRNNNGLLSNTLRNIFVFRF